MTKFVQSNQEDNSESLAEKNKQSLISKVIIVMLGIGMAGFGTQSFGIGSTSRDTAIEAGDTEMSLNQFQQLRANIKNQLRGADDKAVTEVALSRAQQQLALSEFNRNSGYSISDSAFKKQLSTIFSGVDGKFDRSFYEQSKYRLQLTDEQFQSQIALETLKSAIEQSAISVPVEVLPSILMQQPSRNIELVKISGADQFSDLAVTDAEIKAYFESNKAKFDEPEKLELSYVDIDRSKLKIDDVVTDVQLKEAYEEYKTNSFNTEQRKSTYLLFGDNASLASEVAKALLDSSVTWDEAINKYEGQIEEVGEFDFITKSDAESPEIGDALFALESIGKTSPAIKTEFGYLVLKLDDMNASKVKGYDEMKDSLAESLLEKRKNEVYSELIDKLEVAAFEAGASFNTILESLELTPSTTGLVERESEHELLSLPVIQRALVDENGTLKDVNEYIEPLQIDDGRMIIVNVSQFVASTPRALDVVKDDVKKAALEKKRSEAVEKLAKSIQSDLGNGKTLADVAKQHKLTVETIKDLSIQNLPKEEQMSLAIKFLQLPVKVGVENAQIVDVDLNEKAVSVTTSVTLAPTPDEKTLEGISARFSERLGVADFQNITNELVGATKFKVYPSVKQ